MSEKYFYNNTTHFKNVASVFAANFGLGRTGHNVTVVVLDNEGNVSTNATIGLVAELSDGNYGCAITFTEEFNGYVTFVDNTDNLDLYIPFLSVDIGDSLGTFVRVCRILDEASICALTEDENNICIETLDEPYICITTITES